MMKITCKNNFGELTNFEKRNTLGLSRIDSEKGSSSESVEKVQLCFLIK